MASALSDFARRPPGTRAAVYVGVAAALGLLYWQFGLSPVRSAVKESEAELESQVATSRQLAKEKKERDALVATQEQLKAQIEQNQKALPTDAEMPAFFDMLARKFAEAGVQVNRREVKREISVENFVKAPVDVEIVGTYYQIKQFFASLRPRADAGATPGVGSGEKDRIVTVEDVNVSNPRVVNGQLLLTAKFTASTFRAVAPPPPAAPAPGAAPATPPAPAKPTTPATGAAAPSPGTATSAPPLTVSGAKQAADAAYDTSANRGRGLGSDTPPAGSGSGVDRLKGGQ